MTCDECNGSGEVLVHHRQQHSTDGFNVLTEPCPVCGGGGHVPRPLDEREDRLGEEYDR